MSFCIAGMLFKMDFRAILIQKIYQTGVMTLILQYLGNKK
jgi:hypothetical protein